MKRNYVKIVYSIFPFFLLQVWPILQERYFGDFEGKTFPEFEADARASGSLNADGEPWEHTPKGGETIKECRERAGKALQVRVCVWRIA